MFFVDERKAVWACVFLTKTVRVCVRVCEDSACVFVCVRGCLFVCVGVCLCACVFVCVRGSTGAAGGDLRSPS